MRPRWVFVFAVVASLAATRPELRVTPPAPALTHLRAAEFWALPDLRETIDVEAVNRPLLIAAIFHETNRRRVAEGLPAFLPIDRLNDAADLQATLIALRQEIGHENPLPRQGTVLLRVKETGLEPEFVAENVAMTPLLNPLNPRNLFMRIEDGREIFSAESGGPPVPMHTYASFAQAVVDQWMNSPGHRANILNRRLRCLGCAVRPGKNSALMDAIYAVQVFFTPHEQPRELR
jgi:uncharacterized protein YkwD